MNRQGHERANFFIGPEVEHTPAYSKRTLFVVGKQPLDQIERMAREHKTPHIFMGANHSFGAASRDPYWDQVITALLDRGYWVTLDYQAHEHKDVLQMLNKGIWQSRQFVPLLGVRIPNVQTSNVNLTVKIDDVDFAATNPGVWCMHHRELTDSNRFTDWQDYTGDELLSSMDSPTTILSETVAVTEEVAVQPATEVQTGNFESSEESKSELNDSSIGLDPTSPSQLKSEDVAADDTQKIESITTPPDAAAAYASGATEDPLAGKTPKKTGKKA